MATPKIITIALACLLTGCASITPTQKKVAWIAVGVVATSVAISASDGDDAPARKRKVCQLDGNIVNCHFE